MYFCLVFALMLTVQVKHLKRLYTYHLREMALVAIIDRMSELKLEFSKLVWISTEILLNFIFMDYDEF